MNGGQRKGLGLASCVLAIVLGAATAFAQGNGVITGTVVDKDGVVPGATISATDTATGVVRKAVSDDRGVFRLLSVPPGRYHIKIEVEGFKTITVDDFPLLLGESRDLGKLTMAVGALTESLTVTAEVTPVQTSASQLQRTVTGDQLTMIQVKGRDVFGMMKILPGVVDTTASRDFAQWSSGRGLSINGGNSLNKNTTIDGVPVGEEGGDGTTHITPNIDAVGEVTVITSGYTAENGRQSSGLIQIVTKSGTNKLRGSGWYNARRDDWNANDYLREQAGTPKPFFEVNIFGYSVGGPVVIPKLIDSREGSKKLYFFLSQEFTHDVRPTTPARTNLPTAAERMGDFSQTRVTNGSIQPIIDPLTGQPFPGNIIPADRINPMGQAILYLLPLPNGVLDQSPGNQWTSNDSRDVTPLHERKNLVTRVDTVLTDSMRFSVRALFDRDDSVTYNRVAPGIGSVNNMFPGNLLTGAFTKVMSNKMVNEATVGWSQNHWGFKVGTGGINPEDYSSFYRSEVGVNPPRLEAYGAYGDPHLGRIQVDEYPYLPDILFCTQANSTSCGDRSNLASYRPSGGNGPLPRQNENFRYTIQDDLSWNKGHHALKFGVFSERDSKTEPGSNNYNGTYIFGHSADNPLSTGNGYANALLGNFTEYSELTNRVDQENVHWQTDAYAQDTWRVGPRLTLDYGVRVTHAGAVYEVRDMNSGFDPAKWDPKQAPLLFQPFCKPNGVPGNQPCATANRAAINPLTGEIVSQAYAGRTVPGSGSIVNGMFAGGLPGKKAGWYYDMPGVSWGPRGGFAWDLTGDQKSAIRASAGIFYNFINRSQYLYNGGASIARTRTILNDNIANIPGFAAAGTQFVESPQTGNLPGGAPLILHGKQMPQGKLEPEKNYQANVAFQRDIGFHTVAEIAWVGNFGRHFWRMKTGNNIEPYAYANPNNLFRNEPMSANFLRRDYPGMGNTRYLATGEDILNYNAMQLQVQRRLHKGLQMGLAYTLSKNEGIQGWDYLTEELYGKEGLRDRYYGPPSQSQVQDRRHVLAINYSYAIPTSESFPIIIKQVLNNWEASGFSQFTTGNPLDPTCNTNQAGVNNTDPSLSGVAVRCELTGEPILSGYTPDTSVPYAYQAHFNLNAFRRPQPIGAIGNLGNAPVGVLRHPSWWNHDFTLARRFPINMGGTHANLRVQFQLYNVFNLIEYTQMAATYTFSATGNTNANTGKYTAVNNPFNGGITFRLDF